MIKLNRHESIECDVCGKILRRGGMKIHRMSLKCKALVNIKLY